MDEANIDLILGEYCGLCNMINQTSQTKNKYCHDCIAVWPGKLSMNTAPRNDDKSIYAIRETLDDKQGLIRSTYI